ncbi:hypothetical protein [Streptomyces sp. NBC_00203]|uniref:hypothetical protein n=1 Tax=Streptomyces sp. NBC_00203 TaxID=2975680 RepID=UPI00324EAFA3
MKSLKAAVVLAGSLIAATAATPAFAASAPDLASTGQSAPDLASTGLSGGVNTRVPLGVTPAAMLGKESLIHTAKEAATVVNDAKPVHGNLWL